MATFFRYRSRRNRREDIPADKVLCEYCTAKCCRYFALPMDTPETWRDFEFIRWFCCTSTRRCSSRIKPGTSWSIRHASICRTIIVAGFTKRDLRSVASTRPEIASTTRTGCTINILKQPNRCGNLPRPFLAARMARCEATSRSCCRF